MKLLILLGAAALMVTSAASADPLGERKELMKERGAQMRVLAPVAQGKAPFDAAAVLDALEKLGANARATDVDALWPAGSEGGDTKSAPAIWSDMEGFKAAEKKFEDDIAAAIAAKPADLSAFQAVFGPVAANCGACHQKYRL